MKKATFKTLSILLAAVLVVVALPVTAFAEYVDLYEFRPHAHLYEEYSWTECNYYSNEEHKIIVYSVNRCILCGLTDDDTEVNTYLQVHQFDDSIDPELDMEGVCIDCGALIVW